MLDHLKIFVRDPAASRSFYAAALAPLGYAVMNEQEDGTVGMGVDFPHFWIAPGDRTGFIHLAFRAAGTDVVDAFHAAAIAAGATDNGAPGPRPYHPEYYGAFVLDPDGNNVEVVNHGSIAPL
ncbi:MAG: VOC family protein [Thermoleophilaceae bacterium]|nr:VOC family protein [Thermoleophilaceae bacterium]